MPMTLDDRVALQLGRLTLMLLERDAEIAALRERLAAMEAQDPAPADTSPAMR